MSLDAARSARKRGDVECALDHFNRAAERETSGVTARCALAEYLLALHLNDRAEAVLHDIIRLDPARAEAFEGLAQIARRRGDRAASVAVLRAALQENPGNERLILGLVGDLVGLRRFGEAEECIAVLTSGVDPSHRALRAAARIAVSAGNFAQAIERHRAAIAACPIDASGHLELALLLFTHGHVEEAEASLQQAGECDPQSVYYRVAANWFSRRRSRNGSRPEAIAMSAELPSDAVSVRKIVEELRSAGRRDEAEATIEAWLVGRPPDYKLLFLAGVIARERGDLEMELAWVSGMAAAFPDRLEGHKNKGFTLAQMGYLDEARSELLRALAIDPCHFKCQSRLASLERDAGHLSVGIEILEGAVAEHPNDTALQKKLVSFLLLAKLFSRAEQHLNALVLANPHDGSLRELAGSVAETLGHFPAAATNYRAAISCCPDRPATYLALARLLDSDGRPGEAQAVLREAIQTVAFEPRIHLALADIVGHREERWTTCLADIEQALERSPLHVDLLLRRMHCLYRLDRLEAARHCGDALSQAHADEASTLLRIARIAEQAKDFTTACRHYAATVELDPRRTPALISMARSMVRLGQLEEAEAAIRVALTHRADEPTGLVALAEIERRRENRGRAAALMAEALAVEPDNAGFRLTFAEDLYRLDRFSDAEQQIMPLLGERATLPALLCAARIAEARGQKDDALRYLSTAADAHPQSSKAVLGFATALYRFGRPGDAESALRRAVEQHPDWAAAGIQLARLLGDVGRFEESNTLLDEIILRHPGEVEAWVLRSANAARSESTRRAEEFLSTAKLRLEGSSRLAVAQCELAFSRGLDEIGQDLLREAERRFPDDARVRQFRLQRAIIVGRFDVVEAVLDEGRLPAAEVAYWRAQVEAAQLRFPEAEVAYRCALEARPSYRAAISGLIRALVAQLKVEEGRENISLLNQMNIGVLTARQQSLNPSQSFFGEICNDIWLDPDGMRRARAALQLEGVDGLLDVVKLLPEYTGAAVALMIGLRRSEVLTDSPQWHGLPNKTTSDVKSECVCRKLFQFWDAKILPEDVRELAESWKGMNPDWSYTLYNMESAREFMEYCAEPDARRAFRLAHHVAQKADIFRLAVLAREGGVYADADDRCVASLDPLVRGREMVLRHENLGSIGNNFIAVRPRHPVIEAALEGAVRAVLRGDSESIWLSTGPGMLTRALAVHLAAHPTRLSALRRDGSLQLDWELRPFLVSACRASYKSTAKHWSVREFANGLQPAPRTAR